MAPPDVGLLLEFISIWQSFLIQCSLLKKNMASLHCSWRYHVFILSLTQHCQVDKRTTYSFSKWNKTQGFCRWSHMTSTLHPSDLSLRLGPKLTWPDLVHRDTVPRLSHTAHRCREFLWCSSLLVAMTPEGSSRLKLQLKLCVCIFRSDPEAVGQFSSRIKS